LDNYNESQIVRVAIGRHELLALDNKGVVFIWEWGINRRLRKSPDAYSCISDARLIACG